MITPRPLSPLSRSTAASSGAPQIHAPFLSLSSRPVLRIFDWTTESVAAPQSAALAVDFETPYVMSAPLPKLRPRVLGGMLPEGSDAASTFSRQSASAHCLPEALGAPEAPRTSTNANETTAESLAPRAVVTRIRPPRDLVKFEDRLHYLLQPPLENLLAAQSLAFHRQPFPFQLDGIAYLYPRHEAVLADEMGLGKTMQAIVAMRLLAHEGRVRRILVACPKPLVTNWRRELAEWAPELPVAVVEGSQSEREWLWKHAHDGVLIANYEMLVRDRQHAASASPGFDLMVIDEAQRIKNSSSATHDAVCSVPRARSWALTGTPIENSSEDLVGIFQFASPGRLRPQMKPAAIRQAVSDHVLRRTKDNVLTQLPPKTISDVEIGLTAEQWEAYKRAEDDGVVRLNHLGAEVTIHHVFELVLRLKQICNFEPATGASAKLDRLEADLEECAASGRKAIVFSQWVRTIERMRTRLERFGALEFHGRVASNKRDGVLQQFRDDPNSNVLLMSYGAGSVGLNLQFAGYVFLFDRWWNPAVEDQAINRAHRIGAAGPVTVTRFYSGGTIEERINTVLEQKRELFNAVFDSSLLSAKRGLSRDDVFGLFNLKFPESQAA